MPPYLLCDVVLWKGGKSNLTQNSADNILFLAKMIKSSGYFGRKHGAIVAVSSPIGPLSLPDMCVTPNKLFGDMLHYFL